MNEYDGFADATSSAVGTTTGTVSVSGVAVAATIGVVVSATIGDAATNNFALLGEVDGPGGGVGDATSSCSSSSSSFLSSRGLPSGGGIIVDDNKFGFFCNGGDDDDCDGGDGSLLGDVKFLCFTPASFATSEDGGDDGGGIGMPFTDADVIFETY
jgi:hypothetical protein